MEEGPHASVSRRAESKVHKEHKRPVARGLPCVVRVVLLWRTAVPTVPVLSRRLDLGFV